MIIKWKQKCGRILMFFLIGLSVTLANSDDPYSSEIISAVTDVEHMVNLSPRIIIKNGNLVFKTADNRNITFLSSKGGSIQINNEDLAKLVQQAKTSLTSIQEVENTNMQSLSQEIQTLQNNYQNMQTYNARISQLEANITQLARSVNSLRSQSGRQIRQRISALERNVAQLTELLSQNECNSNPCRNGGTCIDAYNGYICQCPTAWEGSTCESDVNECGRFSGTALGCQNGATCYNSPGSYRCECPANWNGIHCTEQHDDCKTGSHEALCGHGTCIDSTRVIPGQPKYKCICDEGWKSEGNNPACNIDIDECNERHISCSRNPPVTCINVPGSFHCGSCPSGFSGNGYICNDINECAINNGGCSISPMVQCINNFGSRTCGPCPAGYTGNGEYCTFVEICRLNNGGCHPLATCVPNTAISAVYRECRCPNGYSGTGEGPNGCQSATGTACEANPCIHGTCQVNGNSYLCICSSGYTGNLCDILVNPCDSNPCRNGGTCLSHQNTFTCQCPNEWQGLLCEEVAESCGGTFYQEIGSIKYPNGPMNEYQHQQSCIWILTTTTGKVFNITFTGFHLESSPDCSYDFLQLNDGATATDRFIGRFCGTDAPGNGSLLTTHNHLYMAFQSDDSIAGYGFNLTWTTVDPVCGKDFEEATHGAISSPGYPNQYPHNRDCYWKIKVPLGKRISIYFTAFKLEHHENCSFDFLKIYDGLSENDPELKKYCTTLLPPPIQTSGPHALLYFHSDETLSDTGFQLGYSAIAGIPGCGGLLTASEGYFSSPNFPIEYDNSIQCDWLIRLHPEDHIELEFVSLNLESHYSCNYDYIEVFDGENEEALLLGRYCNDIPPLLLSSSNNLFVRFVTDGSYTERGFQAHYITSCGGEYTALYGAFHSPNYPNQYLGNRTCIYTIKVPDGYIIEVQFSFFDIEDHTDCLFDYLEIRDGTENGKLIKKFCGTILPEPIYSSYNYLWMKFVTDESVHNNGFLLNYTTSEIGCGGVLTDSHGTLGLLNSPTVSGFLTCNWLLKAEPGFIVRLTFMSFILQDQTPCLDEFVEVNDTTGSKIGRFCGNQLPPVLTSTGNELHVKFESGFPNPPEGFSASYVFLNSIQACGGNFYTESGVVKSPGYPDHYPNNRDCIWVLQVADGHQLSINFTAFNLEIHSRCSYDYVEIRNGGYESSPLIGKFCGTRFPPYFISHSNQLWIHFQSDYSHAGTGFMLIYSGTVQGCGGSVTAPSGTIISPNYPHPYGHNAECNWFIQVAQGSRIEIRIVDLDIEEHFNCAYDFLQIYDGDSERAVTLYHICNGIEYPHLIFTSKNKAYIKFRTDISESGRGFQLNYKIDCHNTLKGHRGIIESPNFPSPYPHDYNCSWIIEAPIGNNISIAFSHLILESHPTCYFDYVEISEKLYDGTEKQIKKYCGEVSSLPSLTVTSNIAIVRFLTDFTVSRGGFRLEWKIEGCGGKLTKEIGSIKSPNYPHFYPLNTSCIWYISVPIGKRILFRVEDFDLEGGIDCSYDFLKIFGGNDITSPLLLHLCHSMRAGTSIQSQGNHITLHFFSDYSLHGKGFSGNYHTIEGGCGGLYNSATGTLISPNYPQNYGVSDDCSWIIQIEQNYLIEITLEDFSMPQSINCSENYLAIFDGATEEDPSLLKYCGEGTPDPTTYKSTTNQMYLRMKADGKNSGKGFKATYRTVCGARILADENGEIMTPNYPHESVELYQCSWTLYASNPENRITLTFTHLSSVNESNCTYHYLQIRDGIDSTSPILQTFCGYQLPLPVVSQGNALHIEYRGGIFRATYGISSSVCGGTLLSESGAFGSPDYPNSYPISSECVWNITASSGNRVQLSFSVFNIEESEFCNTDYLEIRNGNISGSLIGRYCGSNIPSTLTEEYESLWIKFRSDDQGTASGFMAYYNLIHGVTLSGTEGNVASPGFPHLFKREDTFKWIIMVPQSMFVRIEFLEMNTRGMINDGCDSYVAISNGINEYAAEMGKYCSRILPEPLVTTTNAATITFVSSWHSFMSWKLHWSSTSEIILPPQINIVNSACQNNIYINKTSSINFTSPGYPEEYESHLNCTWMIYSEIHRHIRLKILDFETEGYGSCFYYDILTVYIIENPLLGQWEEGGRFCGRNNPFEISSPSNALKVVFTTDGYYNNHRGFKAMALSECGGKIFGTRGILNTSDASPYYGRPPCNWTIIVRPGRTIKITFEQLNIPDDNLCSNQYILIRNGGDSESPLLGDRKICNSVIPTIPESSSNQVFITLVSKVTYSRVQITPTFKLRYEEVSYECGGQLYITNENPKVEISSPNYPNPSPHDVECDWIILGPANSRLRFDFKERFDIARGCHLENRTEFVMIKDGGTMNSEVLGIYCGNHQPNTIYTTGNVIFVRYVTTAKNPHAGFAAEIHTAICGGLMLGSSINLTSPEFPQNYSNNLNCEWNVRTWEWRILKYSFEVLDLADTCNNDFVEIRESNQTGYHMGTYCGRSNISDEFELQDNKAYIKFQTDALNTATGFKLRFWHERADCGGELDSPSGVITSPNFPNPLSFRRFCKWIIAVEEGRRITFTFTHFNLRKDPVNGTCINGLKFMNGTNEWNRYAYICGNSLPAPIDSKNNIAIVLYFSYGTSSNEGFRLSYSSDKEIECGGKLLPPSGTFYSPGFENGSYNNNMECIWKFRNDGNFNGTLSIKFDIFDLDSNSTFNCINDFVVIQEGDLSGVFGYSRRLCGNLTSEKKIVTSPSSGLLIAFHTDSNKTSKGFNASFSIQNCGGIFEDGESTISSPFYPNNYPINSDCHWIYEVEPGSKIQLNFIHFELEDDCNKDYVEIKNGKSWDSPSIQKYCGNQIPNEIISESNHLTVLFHSDNAGSSTGFQFQTSVIQHGCGGNIKHEIGYEEGIISSPKLEGSSRYPNNIECIWIIETNQDFHFLLTFKNRFDIEYQINCTNDYVQIEDYFNHRWNLIGKYCGNNAQPGIKSKSNRVRIKFHSNDDINADGFELSHKIQCGGTFINEESGIISSPGFPSNYSNFMDCEYRIETLSANHIILQFDDRFAIENHVSCMYDYVKVYEIKDSSTSTLLETFCGTNVPNPVSAVGAMLVVFHSDYYIVDRGFMAQFKIFSCGGQLTEPNGIIEMKQYPYSYNLIECTWYITVEESKVIELRFLNFELSNSCQNDFVIITDGSSLYSRNIGIFCGNETPPIIKSSENSLTVRFRALNGITDKGFKAAYRTTYGVQQHCGGNLENHFGEISSVDIDDDGFYESNLDCVWHIIMSWNNVSRITFQLMDIEESHSNTSDCIYDYLEIIDGISLHDPVIGRFCGTQLPNEIISSTNKLLIHFHSDDFLNKQGFKLSYSEEQRTCGGSLYVSETISTLSSPNYPQLYPPNLRCQWIFYTNLSSSYYTRIHLTFHDFDIPCGGDRIEIREDGVDSRTLRFCGNNSIHHYTVRKSILFSFISNSEGAGRGFSLSYQIPGCPQNYTHSNGIIYNIHYPWTYYYRSDCDLFIYAPENYVITLYFNAFYISQRNSQTCRNKGLEIHNGSDITAPILAQYCNMLPNPLFSSSNKLMLRIFRYSYISFSIFYSITNKGPGCGGNLTAINGTFTSPLFPRFYNLTSECRWYILVPGEHTLTLTFDVFALNSTLHCITNYVEIYNTHDELESNKIARYCGNDHPAPSVSQSNGILVKLVTNSTNNLPGFKARFHTNSLGRPVTHLIKVKNSYSRDYYY